jgi:hypothetical protein
VIAHLILFEPRSDLSDQARAEILRAFIAAAAAVPSVRGMRIGRRVRHGLPGYEQGPQPNYEYAAILEFDDVEGLKDYLRHPAHAAAGRHFSASSSSALAYDYTLVAAADAASLLSKNS